MKYPSITSFNECVPSNLVGWAVGDSEPERSELKLLSSTSTIPWIPVWGLLTPLLYLELGCAWMLKKYESLKWPLCRHCD